MNVITPWDHRRHTAMTDTNRPGPKQRGALDNPHVRFHAQVRTPVDDGWESPADADGPTLQLARDTTRRIITYNDSPDVGFDRSINPYRGCEHGCVYCFARPTHAWLDLSPGLDFETRLTYKPAAAQLLREELRQRGYRCQPLMLGINTDAYQPVEKGLRITRGVLEVLSEAEHPLMIVTKSALIERDLDLLAPMAAKGLVQVAVSLTTLDKKISKDLEPRAAAPARRLKTIERLTAAGVPTGTLIAPVIPVLTDPELETLLGAARDHGARFAEYVLLRLPHELKTMFEQWLRVHQPLKAEHVMSVMRASRGGREYDSRFGKRMRGTGPFADLIAQRFRIARQRLAFPGAAPLSTTRFRPPEDPNGQMDLF